MDYIYEKKIERLPQVIDGRASTKGFRFHKTLERDLPNGKKAYIYRVEMQSEIEEQWSGEHYYDVIFPLLSKRVIGWQDNKPIISDDDYVECYPHDEQWGKDAWTCRGYDAAVKKLEDKIAEKLKSAE